jgi:type IV pilus assembly protein PilV
MTSHSIQSLPKVNGYAMLEVLISLIVIAIAMLGAISLQLTSLKMSKSASFHTQAVLLSAEIAERIEANKTAALAGSYVVAMSSIPTAAGADCLMVPCSATELAKFDLAQWTTRIAATLPGSRWRISRTPSSNPATYTISVYWQDRRENVTSVNPGNVENFSYSTLRIIYQ